MWRSEVKPEEERSGFSLALASSVLMCRRWPGQAYPLLTSLYSTGVGEILSPGVSSACARQLAVGIMDGASFKEPQFTALFPFPVVAGEP